MYRVAAVPISLLALALAACSEKASARAEREYEMMERGGASLEDKCAKRREIAEDYLKEGNQHEYWLANVEARNACYRPPF